MRSLYDCPAVPVGSEGVPCRVVVATHPESSKKSPLGVTREGIVYEPFFTNLPQQGFTARGTRLGLCSSWEWQCDGKAASGKSAVASAPGGFCPAAASRYSRRRVHRRACQQLVRHQRMELSLSPPAVASPPTAEVILSRGQRAHSRLSWAQRLARNARPPTAGQVTIRLFGVPESFATALG